MDISVAKELVGYRRERCQYREFLEVKQSRTQSFVCLPNVSPRTHTDFCLLFHAVAVLVPFGTVFVHGVR